MSNSTNNMVMDDILNTPIGSSKRHLIITDVTTKEITTRSKIVRKKVDFKVKELTTDKRFNISDAYVEITQANKNITPTWTIQGLWITYFTDKDGNKTLSSTSALAKLLDHYNAKTVKDMLDKEIVAFPDKNNFLILVACDLPNNDKEIFENLI